MCIRITIAQSEDEFHLCSEDSIVQIITPLIRLVVGFAWSPSFVNEKPPPLHHPNPPEHSQIGSCRPCESIFRTDNVLSFFTI